jgi:polyribonucleotide nucleotidyltransferase
MNPPTAKRVEMDLAGQKLVLETGELARQATTAVLATYGENVILMTLVVGEKKENPYAKIGDYQDFTPFQVEYREKIYAAGRYPGGFIKREGRPNDYETLTCRLIDRPLRPLFPEGWAHDTQIYGTVMSSDGDTLPDVLAVNAASACLAISDVPFKGPVGCVRVGEIDGQFVLNPTRSQLAKSSMDLTLCGAPEGVIMVEFKGDQIPEERVLQAFEFATPHIQNLIELQNQLARAAGAAKKEYEVNKLDRDLYEKIRSKYEGPAREIFAIGDKKERYGRYAELEESIVKQYCLDDKGEPKEGAPSVIDALRAFSALKDHVFRTEALNNRRSDGRGQKEIRPIWCKVGILPRTHGTGLFTRGETQALSILTLGSVDDEQEVDTIFRFSKRFMLHYNFPPFSTGEVKPFRGPGRREIGHGMLAEKALEPIIPSADEFPYTMRIVSEVLASNGSTSMASVCSGMLALMDGGVKVKAPVAGIAMGLIMEGDQVAVLSDILGSEDASGDMDFKVAGSQKGITALQLDLKAAGIGLEILRRALEQAREGRLHILGEMLKALDAPRPALSKYAPKIERVYIGVDKIGMVIGSGGRVVRGIQEATGVEIEFDDDTGHAIIMSQDAEGIKKAATWVRQIAEGLKVGDMRQARVVELREFGCFVSVVPTNEDAMVHVSEFSDEYVSRVEDFVKVGQEVDVKVISVDETTGKVRGSIKQARRDLGKPPLPPLNPQAVQARPPMGPRPQGGPPGPGGGGGFRPRPRDGRGGPPRGGPRPDFRRDRR